MKPVSQRVCLLPGPELEQLISDRVEELKCLHPQIETITVDLWVEDNGGAREKFCEMKVRIQENELRVTKCGPTHILSVLDAIRTVRRRIPGKIKSV